jgi:hypothetical protein
MSEQQTIDFEAARAARDAGMTQAGEHAERVQAGWKDQAFEFLVRFARRRRFFISEDVSDASKEDPTFPQPPTDRAWGSIYVRAAREGVIVQDGSGRSRRRHASICPRRRSLVVPEPTGTRSPNRDDNDVEVAAA